MVNDYKTISEMIRLISLEMNPILLPVALATDLELSSSSKSSRSCQFGKVKALILLKTFTLGFQNNHLDQS